MHCNLRQSDAVRSLSALILLPMPSLKSLSLSITILESFHCLYVTLCYGVTLTFDLEHLWCAGCAVVKLCTKFELNRAIRGRVIAV